jgi:DNA polymerase (family X)
MNNANISDIFNQLSKLTDLHNGDEFKIKNYANAAFQIDKLTESLIEKTEHELSKIRGIGASNAKKIIEIIATGSCAELSELLANTPSGILDIMQVKGIGPKKVGIIWREMNILDIGELLYACSENRLVNYKGFGEKLQATVLQGCEFFLNSKGKYLYVHVENFTHQLLQYFTTIKKWQATVTGQVRCLDTVIDKVSFVIIGDAINIAKELDINYFKCIEITNDVISCEAYNTPIKIHCARKENFGTILLETSGNDIFINDFKSKYQLIDAESEAKIFSHNNLPIILPELRNFEVALCLELNANKLITVQDIKGIIHNHSTYSDGAHTLAQMALACKQKGYQYLVISDHSAYASYAQGLSIERVVAQHQEIDALNKQLAPFKIFKSIECDILPDGSLDYDPQTLASFDIIIASIHSVLNMSYERAMERIEKAIANPFTTILGHPTGRLLLSRSGYPLDMNQVINWCAQYNVVLEVNAHPRRLDVDWSFLPYAMKKNILVSINPDAHSITGIDDVKYGALASRKGGLTSTFNLSSMDLVRFEEFIASYKLKIKNAIV